jgi:GTP-binding protein Era
VSGEAGSSTSAHARPFRSGFACFVGRPNAGKSTLTNALIGQKIAITSSRPQTTRHAIRGILHRDDAQLIVIDTPGLHKPRTLLGSRLNDVVRETWAEVDVIGFCVPADVAVGKGDAFIIEELRSVATRTPVIGVVTKTDLVPPPLVATASRRSWWPTCSSPGCRRARSSTRTASSPTSRRRPSSPS